MRIGIWLCLVLVAAPIFGAERKPTEISPQSKDDPYSVGLVKQALLLAEEKVVPFGVWKSVLYPVPPYRRSIPQLGDGVSVALLKIYDSEDLTKPETAMAALSIVRLAFSSPQSIQLDEDKDPKVTRFLLDFLRDQETANAEVEKDVAVTSAYVKKATDTLGPSANPSSH